MVMGVGHQDIEHCVRSEYERLVRVVSLVSESLAEAEDAVQEAFARAWERQQRGYRFEHLEGWVATVALNIARSGRRRRETERRVKATLQRDRVAPTDSGVEIRSTIQSAVEALPRRQRDAVILYYLLDVDVASAARLLRISEGTVKTALARARRSLAVLLREEDVEA